MEQLSELSKAQHLEINRLKGMQKRLAKSKVNFAVSTCRADTKLPFGMWDDRLHGAKSLMVMPMLCIALGSQTLRGRVMYLLGYFFSAYCAYKMFMSTINFVFSRDPNQDPVTRVLTLAVRSVCRVGPFCLLNVMLSGV